MRLELLFRVGGGARAARQRGREREGGVVVSRPLESIHLHRYVHSLSELQTSTLRPCMQLVPF